MSELSAHSDVQTMDVKTAERREVNTVENLDSRH